MWSYSFWNLQRVLQSIHHPYWVAVFEDNLYWNDWGTQSLEVCHKFTGKNRTVLAKVDKILGKPWVINVFLFIKNIKNINCFILKVSTFIILLWHRKRSTHVNTAVANICVCSVEVTDLPVLVLKEKSLTMTRDAVEVLLIRNGCMDFKS